MERYHRPKPIAEARHDVAALIDLFAVFPTQTVSQWIVHALHELHRAELEHADLPDDDRLH